MATGIVNTRRAARGELVETEEQRKFREEQPLDIQIMGDEMLRQIALDKMESFGKKMSSEFAAHSTGLDPSGESFRRGTNAELEMVRQRKIANNLLDRINASKEKLNKTTKTEIILTDEQINMQSEFSKLLSDTIPEYDKLQAKIDVINESMASGATDKDGHPLFDPEEGARVVEHLQNLQEGLDNVEGFSQAMEDAIISTSQAFSKEFVDALLDGENALDSFKNFAKDIVSQIIAIFLQMAVINKILNQIFNAGLPEYNIGGMGDGGSGVTGIQTGVDYAGHAAGGKTLQSNTPYVVGERGAEIFVPNTGGSLMNNMNSKGMGGGTTVIVNQSVNFATGIVPTVRAEVTKMMPMISDVTKGAVLEAAVRGGSFKKGLMGSG